MDRTAVVARGELDPGVVALEVGSVVLVPPPVFTGPCGSLTKAPDSSPLRFPMPRTRCSTSRVRILVCLVCLVSRADFSRDFASARSRTARASRSIAPSSGRSRARASPSAVRSDSALRWSNRLYWQSASSSRSSGRTERSIRVAFPTSTGITRTPRPSAVWISRRVQSCSASRAGRPSAPAPPPSAGRSRRGEPRTPPPP